MMVLALVGSLSWGVGTSLLFLYLVERDVRLVVDGRCRWPLTRWLRPLVAAILVFAPAFLDSIAILGSLLGFILGKTIFLTHWTRTTKGRSTS